MTVSKTMFSCIMEMSEYHNKCFKTEVHFIHSNKEKHDSSRRSEHNTQYLIFVLGRTF